jgi:hypothetical protein
MPDVALETTPKSIAGEFPVFFRGDGLAFCLRPTVFCGNSWPTAPAPAAGVPAMGLEKIYFFWYVKKISGLALIGYFAGAAVYIVQYRFLHG